MSYIKKNLPLDMLCTLIEEFPTIQPFLKLAHYGYVNDIIYP